ncbi:MAG: lamin tail domain-containing protein [Patescibacteria group bacterium]|nr:lamin tail domain-containing protein [Patescibacteria group bacterium]
MVKQFLLLLFFVFLTLSPNYCFSSSIYNQPQSALKIQEIKTRGLTIASSAAKWFEIANISNSSVNLNDICFASSVDKINLDQPKNCFSDIDLNFGQSLIVAYSGDAFLADNNLDFNEINGLLLELGGYGSSFSDNPLIPNLIAPYKTSFLNITDGQLIIYVKTTGEIIDEISWVSDQGIYNSWQRPVYDANFSFVASPPTPFQILPEYIDLLTENLGTDQVSFDVIKINSSSKNIVENFSLWQNNQLFIEQEVILNKLIFKNLSPNQEYEVRINACEVGTDFCFLRKIFFTTKQNYLPLLINELYPAPDAKRKESEWLEIYNPNNKEIDLNGWFIKDLSGHTLNLSGKINAYGFFVIYPGSKLSLNNNNEIISLFDPNLDLHHKVKYNKALKRFSYSRFNNKFSWSRKNTPNKKNILIPQYLKQKIEEIRNQPEQVQTQGKIIMAPGDFANSYFYLNDGSFVLKIKTNKKLNLNRNQCLQFFGQIKNSKEKYLKLDYYSVLENCNLILPAVFITPVDEPIDTLVGRMIKIYGLVYTEKSSYFINYNNQKIKLRSLFKMHKGSGDIRGILSFGTTYYQLFLIDKDWFKVAPQINSPPKKQTDKPDSTKPVLAGATSVKGVSYDALNDYRLNEKEDVRINYFFLIFYYLSVITFFALAKFLIFS